MPRSADEAQDWLRRANEQPDFAQRLALTAKGGGSVVFDHVAEAAHAWVAALVCQTLSKAGKTRIWLVGDAPRQRERLGAELELWGVRSIDLPEMPAELEDGALADPEAAAARLEALDRAATSERFVILCAPDAFSQPAPSPAGSPPCAGLPVAIRRRSQTRRRS